MAPDTQFTPILIGMSAFFTASITSRTRTSLPIFPGLMRILFSRLILSPVVQVYNQNVCLQRLEYQYVFGFAQWRSPLA